MPLTLTNYQVIITERYVRHVKNGHRDDLKYICTIEPNKRTKKPEVCLVFEKRYDNQTVKLVKLRNLFKKSLSLKTIFRKD